MVCEAVPEEPGVVREDGRVNGEAPTGEVVSEGLTCR